MAYYAYNRQRGEDICAKAEKIRVEAKLKAIKEKLDELCPECRKIISEILEAQK